MKESPENKKGMLHRGRHSIDTCERILQGVVSYSCEGFTIISVRVINMDKNYNSIEANKEFDKARGKILSVLNR